MALMTEQEGIDYLKIVIPAGEEFGLSAAQRHLKWGYNRAARMMEIAVATGQVVHGENEWRFKFKG